jgi:hypothetical protein
MIDIITGFLIINTILFALFYRLEILMALMIYPLVTTFFVGIMKIMKGTNRNNRGNQKNLNRVLYGISSIIFSILFLRFFLGQPSVTFQNIINLAAYPLLIVGFASVIKGFFINLYSMKFRIINVLIGIITMIICMLALLSPFFFPPDYVLFHILSLSTTLIFNLLGRAALYLSEFNSLSTTLIFNLLGRAALYLSEFNLSLFYLKNFKIFFYIISDYLIYVNEEGNIVLHKRD